MTSSPADRMAIGEFSAATRLSPRALRLYDACGLLRPAYVDDASGYRWYTADQVAPARRILLLRAIGMPLAAIASVPADPAQAVEEVRRFWQRAEREHDGRRELVRHLTRVLTGEPSAMFPISLRDVPPQTVATLSRRLTVADLSPYIDSAVRTLTQYVGDSGAALNGPMLVIYHGVVDEDSDGPVEVCVPYDGRVDPAGDIAVRVEPAHLEAYTPLTRAQLHFPEVLQAYDAVADWIGSQPLHCAASPREVYVGDMATTAEQGYLCDVAYPVTRAD